MELVAVTELIYIFSSAGIFLMRSITELFIPVQKIYRRNSQHFLFLLLYISLCRMKFLLKAWQCSRKSKLSFTYMIFYCDKSDANLPYPSTKIGSLGADFSEKLKKKV